MLLISTQPPKAFCALVGMHMLLLLWPPPAYLLLLIVPPHVHAPEHIAAIRLRQRGVILRVLEVKGGERRAVVPRGQLLCIYREGRGRGKGGRDEGREEGPGGGYEGLARGFVLIIASKVQVLHIHLLK
jgi:hypothetical protein